MMGLRNERAPKYSAKSNRTGVNLAGNAEAADCDVCLTFKSIKKSHPPNYQKRSCRRLEQVHADVVKALR